MDTYEYQRLRGLKRKLYLVELRGGKCEKCGYDKNLSALDFHHKDPTKKSFMLDIRKLANMSMEKILVEFKKCEVLCANCHREKHSPDLVFDKVRLLTEKVGTDVYGVKPIRKTECLDCGVVVNYGSKRCKPCNHKHIRKVERPDLKLLQIELDTYGVTWCSKKYCVVSKTIYRWITNNIS